MLRAQGIPTKSTGRRPAGTLHSAASVEFLPAMAEISPCLAVVAPRVLVHLGDRRAGDDVVELVQAEQLPEPLELGARVRREAAPVRERGEQLDVVQQELAPASTPALG